MADRANLSRPLLDSILRRVRQRAFVILNPHEIARVEIAAAERTFHVLSQPDIAWINDTGGVPGLLQGRILR